MWTETVDGGTQVVNFNAAVYGLSAIRKAARTFDRHFYVLIEQHDRITKVWLIPKECCTSPDAFVVEFCNEVLDQELRQRVTAEMAGIRRRLIANFFPECASIM